MVDAKTPFPGENPLGAVGAKEGETCARSQITVTNEEAWVVLAMQRIKEEVRDLRKQQKKILGEIDLELFERPQEQLDGDECNTREAQRSRYQAYCQVVERLGVLRQQWQEWTRRRDDATTRKHVMLGYAKADGKDNK